jgi:hypothetical protein
MTKLKTVTSHDTNSEWHHAPLWVDLVQTKTAKSICFLQSLQRTLIKYAINSALLTFADFGTRVRPPDLSAVTVFPYLNALPPSGTQTQEVAPWGMFICLAKYYSVFNVQRYVCQSFESTRTALAKKKYHTSRLQRQYLNLSMLPLAYLTLEQQTLRPKR